MNISTIKAVIFDCDGVMFDTALANRKYYDEVLGNFNKPPLNDEQFIHIHMMTVKAAIEYLFPERDDLSDVFESLKDIGYQKFIQYMAMESDLEKLLAALKKNGFFTGVATNRTNTMEKVLEDYHLTAYFDIVMTAAKVKQPKPDPEQLLVIMETLALKPEEILFVGDSEYDSQAGHAAKVNFVAFKSDQLAADVHVDSMGALADVLNISF